MVTITTITAPDPWQLASFESSMTKLAPLLTTFEPPAGCSTQWISDLPGTIWSGWDAINNGLQTDYFARCNPYTQLSPGFSPGVCASGQNLVEITEWHLPSSVVWEGICCDRGMTLHESSGWCAKTITSPLEAYTSFTTTVGTTLGPWAVCDSGNLTVFALDLTTSLCSRIHEGIDGVSVEAATFQHPPTEVLSGSAIASPLWVYWQSSDLIRFPVEYASSLASRIKVPFTATTQSNTTTQPNTTIPEPERPTPDVNNKGPSLNPGAIAGIAIGIGALVISGIVVLLHLWRRRKRRQRAQHPDVPEMEGSSRGLKHFMGGKWRAETDGTSEPVEAGSTSVRIIPGPPVELDGTQGERNQ